MAVSSRPLTWEDVGSLPPKAGPVTGRWKGIIWAARRCPQDGGLPAGQWAAPRVWGELHVMGDPALLDRIECEAGLRP
jgi:hypothetical protein